MAFHFPNRHFAEVVPGQCLLHCPTLENKIWVVVRYVTSLSRYGIGLARHRLGHEEGTILEHHPGSECSWFYNLPNTSILISSKLQKKKSIHGWGGYGWNPLIPKKLIKHIGSSGRGSDPLGSSTQIRRWQALRIALRWTWMPQARHQPWGLLPHLNI